MKKILIILNLNEAPRIPLLLAMVGVIPFIFLSLGIWFLSDLLKSVALYYLLNYSVIIITFIGAIYWGVAMEKGEKKFTPYFISVIPALLCWFMFMGFFSNYILILVFFLFSFFFMYLIDLQYVKSNFFPIWYLALRKIVSVIVIICLGFAAIGVNIKIL
tara:strand:- start:1956 stop:2435 length:480 start_codon:yes stop_codon:yes gene_type:complete